MHNKRGRRWLAKIKEKTLNEDFKKETLNFQKIKKLKIFVIRQNRRN